MAKDLKQSQKIDKMKIEWKMKYCFSEDSGRL